jgi:hypothetical protein
VPQAFNGVAVIHYYRGEQAIENRQSEMLKMLFDDQTLPSASLMVSSKWMCFQACMCLHACIKVATSAAV